MFLGLPTFLPQEFSPLLQGAEFSTGTQPQIRAAPCTAPCLSTASERRQAGSIAQVSQDDRGARRLLPRAQQPPRQPKAISLVFAFSAYTKELVQDCWLQVNTTSSGQFLEQHRGTYPTGTYPTGQDTECSLMDVHDGIVLSFVAIYFLRQSIRLN